MRSFGVVAVGLGFATLLVAAWPGGGQVAETDLPAVTERPVLRTHDPVMRVAATLVRAQDAPREADRRDLRPGQ